MIVKIPERQEVRYVPGALHVFKYAWVQYFFAFLFWYFLLYEGLLAFLVQTRVFEVKEVTDLNVRNLREK